MKKNTALALGAAIQPWILQALSGNGFTPSYTLSYLWGVTLILGIAVYLIFQE